MSTPLQRAREAKGLTQTQLADLAEVRQSTISRLESEPPAMVASPELAEKLANALGISELEVLYPERFPLPDKRRKAA